MIIAGPRPEETRVTPGARSALVFVRRFELRAMHARTLVCPTGREGRRTRSLRDYSPGGGRKEPRRKTPELRCSGCALVWVNLSANSLATDLWVVA